METLKNLQGLVRRLEEKSSFYQQRFKEAGVVAADIHTMADFEKLPFTDKGDLRNSYPLGLQAVPDSEVVRIHSSSGTTGTPVIIPYTAKDVEDWAIMFSRCYEYAGMTNQDRIQITPGYGLWTAGIGFQAGAEKLGAMAIPMGPGNTQKQLQMMVDLKTTVLASTSSYALLLAEEVARHLKEKRAAVVNLHRLPRDYAQRTIDFLTGVVFALDGSIQKIGHNVILCTPKSIGVHGEISLDSDEE